MNAKRALRAVPAPDESGAEQRAWTVVRGAYADRAPAPTRRPRWRIAVVPTVIALAGVLALSPAGAVVGRWINRALGVPHSAAALFSLPAPGRLLVSGPGGTWTIAAGGSARRLGSWQDAAWSPHGMFIAVSDPDELAAVDPRGTQRWTLARPAVSDAAWYPPTGYRVAYLSGHQLRVVAGDGTGDHLLAADAEHVAPAWRAAHPYQIAYVDHTGTLLVRDADSGHLIWDVKIPAAPRKLAWSADGTRLLAVTRSAALVYTQAGALSAVTTPPSMPILDGSLSPDGRTIALVRGGAGNDVVLAHLTARRPHLEPVLSGDGLQQLAWSPNGRWLLISWPPADQWVFVRVVGAPRIAAVSHITRQFAGNPDARGFPQIEGWCCTLLGAPG